MVSGLVFEGVQASPRALCSGLLLQIFSYQKASNQHNVAFHSALEAILSMIPANTETPNTKLFARLPPLLGDQTYAVIAWTESPVHCRGRTILMLGFYATTLALHLSCAGVPKLARWPSGVDQDKPSKLI